jgi:hypothetical protein
VNPSSLTFSSSSIQSFTLGGGAGTVTKSDQCSGIASLSGPPGGVADGTWTVTPQSNGSCSVSFGDGSSSVTVYITVNIQTTTTNSTMNWPIANSCRYTAYLKLFDRADNFVWPAPPQEIVLDQIGQTQTLSISCKTGANICYGASVSQASDSPLYWGVGITGNQGCPNCCYACANGTVPPVNLTCQ